jgi:hypothetical protein
MKFSSLFFVASLAVAPLCGLSSTAMAQTAAPPGGATTSLPNVLVEAPKQVTRPQEPKQRAVRSTVFAGTSPTTPTASPMSPAAELARLEKRANAAGSCADGCVTSFRSSNAPWRGCSGSGWPALSSTCRNVGHWKTYAACMEDGLKVGWRSSENGWYCSSLALK